jgi:lipopolysaccharide/colanic/teichoic acid biosynthesis glycosyltransferase
MATPTRPPTPRRSVFRRTAPPIEEAGRLELARGRRFGRPFTLLTLRITQHRRGGVGRRPEVELLAERLAAALRTTDAVGPSGPLRVMALLAETPRDQAELLVVRLSAELPPSDVGQLRVGLAAFPEDAATWDELKGLAAARERPLWPPETPGASGQERRGRDATRGQEAGTSLRRCIDIASILLLGPILLIVVPLIALAIKLDSPGPVLWRHARLGRGGRRFQLLKFRTMVQDADRLKGELAHLNTMAWPDFKIQDDPRVTRLGRWLRRTSLDELPQLWNVLRGEMTLFGPRACSVQEADYALWQTERLEAIPGLFGTWQAEGRNQADFATRCRMDIRQIRSESARGDVRLAVRTIYSLLRSGSDF